MKWQNVGSAPCYCPYRVAYRLSNDKGDAVALVGGVTVNKWMPGSVPLFTEDFYKGEWDLPNGEVNDVLDKIALPADIAPGRYRLAIAVIGEKTLAPAIRLGIQGRAEDGWYPLSQLEIAGSK